MQQLLMFFSFLLFLGECQWSFRYHRLKWETSEQLCVTRTHSVNTKQTTSMLLVNMDANGSISISQNIQTTNCHKSFHKQKKLSSYIYSIHLVTNLFIKRIIIHNFEFIFHFFDERMKLINRIQDIIFYYDHAN